MTNLFSKNNKRLKKDVETYGVECNGECFATCSSGCVAICWNSCNDGCDSTCTVSCSGFLKFLF